MQHDPINEIISEQNNVVLLKSKGNNGIYATTDGERYENLTQGTCGRVEKQSANRLFTIPIKLNYMQQQNPTVIKLIAQLGLAIES